LNLKDIINIINYLYRAIPFNVHTPPYGWVFLKGDSKVVSEGLILSASFDLCDISEG
jgi:hypothetical protein